MKKTIIILFLSILYVPLVLGLVSKISNIPCDVHLKGYTDSVVRPYFSWNDYLTSDFQSKFSSWFETNFYPRGLFIKTYSTIRYHLFNQGNRPIGYNKDIFEWGYINSELSINTVDNLSDIKNQERMKDYVRKLEQVQDKLAEYNKYLYVYIAPSKADFHYDNLLDKYKNISDEESIKPVNYFRELMSNTEIPYFICSDKKDTLKYPAFYSTGIHWSRTFEQEVSAQIIKEISIIANKSYRNIVLGEVKKSYTPYWRDSDVFDLLNIWSKVKGCYYKYVEQREYLEQYDKIRILIHGDSFGLGIRTDLLEIYPYEEVHYFNRNIGGCDIEGNYAKILSWDKFDISNYLNNVDVILIEMVEPELTNYSMGFIEYLNLFLDSYVPTPHEYNYIKSLNCNDENEWPDKSVNGIYHKEDDFFWAKDYSEIYIKDKLINEIGLEIDFSIPPELFLDGIYDIVQIYINGKRVYRNRFEEPWSGSIFIDNKIIQDLNGLNDLYNVEIYCSKKNNLKISDIVSNKRNKAIKLRYVGRIR